MTCPINSSGKEKERVRIEVVPEAVWRKVWKFAAKRLLAVEMGTEREIHSSFGETIDVSILFADAHDATIWTVSAEGLTKDLT